MERPKSAVLTMLDIAGRVPDSEVRGEESHRVERLVHPAEVTGSHDLCLLMSLKALDFLQANGSKHRCAIVDRQIAESLECASILAKLSSYLVVDRPRYALARLSPMFRQQTPQAIGVHPSAILEDGVELGKDVSIGPGVWIGRNARIGDNTTILPNTSICEGAVVGASCTIFPGVYIGHHVQIGNRVIVHPNASLGGDGFAFESAAPNSAEEARRVRVRTRGKNERLERIESLGTLHIGDDVEIGACTTIDRSTLGRTVVGSGTKIDNLVQIGHGNVIGEDVLLCAQVGLAGSSKIGDGAVLAGKVGVADHRVIGANAVLMAKSGVTKDIPAGEVYYGMPARPVRETLRQISMVAKLDKMSKRIAALEAKLAEGS